MRLLLFALLAVCIIGCETASVYEGSKDINNRIWVADSILNFGFDVRDPAVPHQINLAIRNTSTYPFYNLYVVYYLKDSVGNLLSTDLVNFHLFDAKTGRPQGSGIGGIFSHKLPLIEAYRFEQPGFYNLEVEQNMRIDSLPGIVSIGVEITK
jgi:gliding motility-associated lipoprotein GldH